MQSIKQLFKSNKFTKESYEILNDKKVEQFTSDPQFPFLVSFPRTGSHWLRNVMELYFEAPSLIRVFYYNNPKEFTCFHSHDEDLLLFRKNVIYLYREPIETIFSQMKYYNEDLNDLARIRFWSEKYGHHLNKWLFIEQQTEKKTIIKYQNLQKNFPFEFKKITSHLNRPFDQKKLNQALSEISKEKIKSLVKDDKHVVDTTPSYKKDREIFKDSYGETIYSTLLSINNNLSKDLFG